MGSSHHAYKLPEWERLLAAGAVPKPTVNQLVLEYLLAEGMVDSAARFKEETLGHTEDLHGMQHARRRNEVCKLVLSRRMNDVIDALEQCSPRIWDNNEGMLFRLRKHILIQKIMDGELDEAVRFAQEELAPLAQDERRKDLEEVMSLLIFEDVQSSPMAYLLRNEELEETARQVNVALLRAQGLSGEPAILKMLQEAQWSEESLRQSGVSCPSVVRAEKRADNAGA